MCATISNMVALGQSVLQSVGVSTKLGTMGPPPLDKDVIFPRNTLLSTCAAISKICCSRSNHLDVGWGSQNFADAVAPPLQMGTCLSPRSMLLPQIYYHATFGHSRSHHSSVIMLQDGLLLAARLLGLSLSPSLK